jgi:hypothetical protein
MRRIKSLAAAFVLGFSLAGCATVAANQVDIAHTAATEQADEAPRPRFVVMDDYVREYLAKEWDKNQTLPLHERGYCLRFQLDFWADEVAYRVTQISEPDNSDASTHDIDFTCPKKLGEVIAEVHIHPAQTCASETQCWPGGIYGYQCLPSDADRRYLKFAGQPFGMVQCDRKAVVFYFPMGDNR